MKPLPGVFNMLQYFETILPLSVPLHNATPRTWTSEILWRVELKCRGTGNQGVLLRVFLDVR